MSGRVFEPRGLELVVPHERAAKSVALPMLGTLTIGRDESCEISIDHKSVSRKHARVWCGPRVEVEDLGSTNGTRVMGRKVKSGERVELTAGTALQVGDLNLFVRLSATAEAAPDSKATNRTETGGPESALRDPVMLELYELAYTIGPSRLPVLLLGETGVGKDVYAEAVHYRSDRVGRPFLKLNCAALPENLLEAELFGYEKGAFTGALQAKPGLFESADTGTVFLDEVGDMPLTTQAKILRVLENGEVMRVGSVRTKRIDVRFISATNRDLEARAAEGAFREDLYHRLSGVIVRIPPLRDRPSDVGPLADLLMRKASAGRAAPLGDDVRARLEAHDWPGNVRELRNVMDRALMLSRGATVEAKHIVLGAELGPSAVAAGTGPSANAGVATKMRTTVKPPMGSVQDELEALERTRVLQAMEQAGGNQTRAAQLLGWSRGRLIRRLEDYDYQRPRRRDGEPDDGDS